MLSGLSSYLFGAPSEEEHPAAATQSAADLAAVAAAAKQAPRLRTSSTEDDWTIVDRDPSRASSPARSAAEARTNPMSTSSHSSSSRGSSQYHVHAHTPSASSDEDDDDENEEECHLTTPLVHFRHPSLHESWLVTPPPCFTLGGSSPLRLEDHPMENLLIEHPSMSVYQQRGRANSRGADSEESEAGMDTSASAPSRPAANPRHTRSARLAAAAGVTAVAMKSKKAAQVAQKRKDARHVNRHQLERNNKVQKFNSASKIPRRKQLMQRANSGRNNDRKCQY